jgi:hypothetical protein
MASRARAQSLATVLVLELADAFFPISFDYEHGFAEHEHDFRHRSRFALAYLGVTT